MAHQMNTTSLIAELPALVSQLPVDPEFFASGLDKFTMVLSDEDDTADKDEPDYGAILPTAYAEEWANTPELMLVHYLHIMGHKRCSIFWRRCPASMSDFTKSEIDFIEECYIQRMFLEQSEQLHDEFYQCIVAFEEYRKWTHPSLRQAMNTMMYRNASCLHPVLQEIHDVLYANDPFDQRTFNLYISMWAQTIKNGGRYMIDVYDTVVAEK